MCNWLRDGWAGEIGPPIPRCTSVSQPLSLPGTRLFSYMVYLRIARDPRFERLHCTHGGTYADDCLVQRVTAHKCYVVATCDRELRRRIRQIPGVPLMYIVRRRYAIERLPDQGAPTWSTSLDIQLCGLHNCCGMFSDQAYPWECSVIMMELWFFHSSLRSSGMVSAF